VTTRAKAGPTGSTKQQSTREYAVQGLRGAVTSMYLSPAYCCICAPSPAGPPPALKKALQYVDITSARGAIMTSEQGDLCLEVQFGPTAKTKRTLRNVVILGGVLLALLLIIIISVVVAKHRS